MYVIRSVLFSSFADMMMCSGDLVCPQRQGKVRRSKLHLQPGVRLSTKPGWPQRCELRGLINPYCSCRFGVFCFATILQKTHGYGLSEFLRETEPIRYIERYRKRLMTTDWFGRFQMLRPATTLAVWDLEAPESPGVCSTSPIRNAQEPGEPMSKGTGLWSS